MAKRRLNIVYVADIPQVGGASQCLYDIVRTMTFEHDVECCVLFPTHGPLKTKLDSIGIRTAVTGHRGFLVSRPESALKIAPKYVLEYVRYYANRDKAVRKAEEVIDFSTVDIIHSNLPRNDLGVMLAQKYRIPHICHLREYSFEGFHCWSYRQEPVQYLSNGSSAFIAVSHACGNAWVKRGIPQSKVYTIYDGIDLSQYLLSPGSMQYRRTGDQIRLLFLGGCSEIKGVMDAVDAIGMLPDAIRHQVTLSIYGWSPTGSERAVSRRVEALGLTNLVRICGVCDNVASLLGTHDIGLVCSKSEAFGRIIVEFQAAGMAVIGSDVGSIPELLDNGKKGLLYAKKEGPPSLAHAIEYLVDNPKVLTSLRDKGPTYASAFGIDRNAHSCRKLYESVLEQSSKLEG